MLLILFTSSFFSVEDFSSTFGKNSITSLLSSLSSSLSSSKKEEQESSSSSSSLFSTKEKEESSPSSSSSSSSAGEGEDSSSPFNLSTTFARFRKSSREHQIAGFSNWPVALLYALYWLQARSTSTHCSR